MKITYPLENIAFKGFHMNRPFTKKGKPQRYLQFLSCFFDGEPKTKEEVMLSLKLNPGSYTDYFSFFGKTGLLRYENRRWYQGEKYNEYLLFLLGELLKNEVLRKRFSKMLIDHGSNTINFITEDE